MILAVTDPWQPYAAKKPVVPEPSTYGIVFILVATLLITINKLHKTKK